MRLPARLVRAPVRPDRDSLRRFVSLRWAALPIVDRRWTVPMSAAALGFGIFVGVAVGPGAEGSLGTQPPVIVRVAPPPTQTAEVPPAEHGDHATANGSGGGGGGGDNASPAPAPGPGPAPDDSVFDSPPLGGVPTTTPPVSPTPPQTATTTSDTDQDNGGQQDVATTEVAGTVVHLNPDAASYTIADDNGRLLAIHSHKTPAVGKRVEVEVRTLANGTYSEDGKVKERGNRGQVTIAGTITFSDAVTGAYTVSGPGVSLLVRGPAQRTPPAVGDRVEVKARIADRAEELPVTDPGEDGCGKPPALPASPRVALEQVSVERQDEVASTGDVEAIVEGVCRSDRKLIVSADDLRESGHDIAIAVPKDLRIEALKPGQVLKLGVDIGSSRALTLSRVAGDQGAHGAEDADLVQP